MKIINLTPHSILLLQKEGIDHIVFPPSGGIARMDTTDNTVGHIVPQDCIYFEQESNPDYDFDRDFDSDIPPYSPTGKVEVKKRFAYYDGYDGEDKYSGQVIPVCTQEEGEITGLPEPQDGTMYIVSTMVRKACPSRTDLYSPGPTVRDTHGHPVGCRILNRNKAPEKNVFYDTWRA